MNSFYKKIALVCLVSLTANQAVQAFQLSDMWGWMKENPKKSFLISCVGAYVGFVIILGLKGMIRAKQAEREFRRRPALWTTTTAPASSHAQPATVSPYTYTTYAATWTGLAHRDGKQILMPEAKVWVLLSDEDRATLREQCQVDVQKWHEPMGDREMYVTVARDRQQKIAGAIFYETNQTLGSNPLISITHIHGETEALKTALYKPLIKTGENIKIAKNNDASHALGLDVREHDGGNLVAIDQYILLNGKFEQGIVFDRSEARAKRLLESGRDGSRAEASHV